MISLKLAASIADDEEFLSRVAIGFNVIAHEVLKESSDVPEHVLRANHANAVLQWKKEVFEQFVTSVVSVPEIQQSNVNSSEQIEDKQILNAVRAIWNATIGIR